MSRLNDRVDVLSATLVKDAGAGRTKRWSSVGDRWANVSPLTGRGQVRLKAMHMETRATHEVRLRDRPDPPDPARFVYGGSELRQVGPRVHLRRERLWLYFCDDAGPVPPTEEAES